MRIAMFHNLGPGGALRCFEEYRRRLSAEHDVRFFTFPGSGVRARRSIRALRQYRHLAAEIDAQRLDVVFVHPCSVFQAPPLLQYLRTPSVYYMQEPRRSSWERLARDERRALYAHAPLHRWVSDAFELGLRRSDLRSARSATMVVANSYFSIEAVARVYGVDAILCPLGVDMQVFAPPGQEVRANQLLSVGGVVPHKCHDFVIRAAANIPLQDRPTVAIVSERGLPRVQGDLLALGRNQGVQVQFHTRVAEDELVQLYSSSLTTMCASRLEPFGLTAIESQACGTPVIAVQEGGYRETVVHGMNGYLVPRDPIRAAEAVRLLQRAPLDRTSIRAQAVRTWSWEASICAVTTVFESVRSVTRGQAPAPPLRERSFTD